MSAAGYAILKCVLVSKARFGRKCAAFFFILASGVLCTLCRKNEAPVPTSGDTMTRSDRLVQNRADSVNLDRSKANPPNAGAFWRKSGFATSEVLVGCHLPL